MSGKDDTKLSTEMLDQSLEEILNRVNINNSYDIPYVSGYSIDGETIYIDRHVDEKWFQYLVMHESVEKALLDAYHLIYQHAHQISLRVEQELVEANNLDWEEYNNIMDSYIRSCDAEDIHQVPLDLDLMPYIDENDKRKILEIQDRQRNLQISKTINIG